MALQPDPPGSAALDLLTGPTATPVNSRPLRQAAGAALELLKPITWFPPMWAFSCGVVSSGQGLLDNWSLALLGIVLAGPMVCATSQAINDWFDRHVDAINEPSRPIPSGRLPGSWGLRLALLWTLLSVAVASLLGPWGFAAGMAGLVLAWAYSMPPIRLKQNGWLGIAACGLAYEGLAWLTGYAVMTNGQAPTGPVIWLALLYSTGAAGIMALNDFKAIAGDQAHGIRSLPVLYGPQTAARLAIGIMLLPQVVVMLLLLSWGHPWAATSLMGLLAAQTALMIWFERAPIERALMLSGFGVPLFVSGMMISAWQIGAGS
ncbi:MAG: bacteriochlorophyll/chlorophyll synthetase family protein [Pseudomonadota bacterium]